MSFMRRDSLVRPREPNGVDAGIYGGLPGAGGGLNRNRSGSMIARVREVKAGVIELVDATAEMAPWYVSGTPREGVKRIALEIMKAGEIGEFIVRDIESAPEALGISVKMSSQDLSNFMINRVAGSKTPQLQIRGCKETFPTLSELVRYYSKSKSKSLGVKLVVANFDLFEFDQQPNTLVGSPNDVYGEVGTMSPGSFGAAEDPNYGYANTDMAGALQDMPTNYNGSQFGMPAMPAMPVMAPLPANARERTVVSVGELHQLHTNTAALQAHSTQLKISMEQSKAHMAAQHDSQISQLKSEHEHLVELLKLEHAAALREKDRDVKEKELEIEAVKRDHDLELKRRDNDLQEVVNSHKQTIVDIENVVASENQNHEDVLNELASQHKHTIQQIEDVVQAETQEHLQVLAQAEQNGMAHHEVVGQFEKMALSRQDVTQQLKQRMDHFATRVRILEKEIAGHQDAEHAAFEQECQYWEGALRTARDRYEREMEDLETRYFAVCRQAHIVVPAEMILMKKKRKTDRVVLEGAEAQRIAETLQHTANKRQGVQQRLDHSDQEHSRVWQGKAVQRDLELGGQSISDLQRKVAEARVKSNMEQAQARHEEFTGPQSLTTEAVSRANRIEQMAQDARAARDNAYAARVMRETQHNEEPHFSAKALANGNMGRESPMTLLLREHTQAHAQAARLSYHGNQGGQDQHRPVSFGAFTAADLGLAGNLNQDELAQMGFGFN